MCWEAVLLALQLFVALLSLMKKNIDHFILVADVLGGSRHERIDGLTEKSDITSRVVLDTRNQARHRLLVLLSRVRSKWRKNDSADEPGECPLTRWSTSAAPDSLYVAGVIWRMSM